MEKTKTKEELTKELAELNSKKSELTADITARKKILEAINQAEKEKKEKEAQEQHEKFMQSLIGAKILKIEIYTFPTIAGYDSSEGEYVITTDRGSFLVQSYEPEENPKMEAWATVQKTYES
uniref:Uncharacterized protein n=1 Tax=viral metagenome TaxID=1070528 RepID=A0A6M3J3N5_9ZZZZ